MTQWQAHDAGVAALAFLPDGRLLSNGYDSTIRLWDVPTRTELRRWPNGELVGPLAVSADGRYFARGFHPPAVFALDRDEPLAVGKRPAYGVGVAPDGSTAAFHGYDVHPLTRWALPGGGPLPGGWGGVRTDEQFPCGPLAYSPDGTLLAANYGVLNAKRNAFVPTFILWDAATGERRGELPGGPKVPHPTAVAWSPDGRHLAGVYGPHLLIFDVAARAVVGRHKPGTKHLTGLAFAGPDRLLTVGNDGAVRAWAGPGWAEAGGYAWDIGKPGAGAVAADGLTAAVGGDAGRVAVWDIE
jgi:WD40 repeat protein